MQSESTPDAGVIAGELDAAHERAHRAYAARDAVGYMAVFHEELEYKQRDGQTIGRAQLARDVRTQLARVHAATTEFRRERLEVDVPGTATEILAQHVTFEVRAFGIVHRAWSVQRRGRYEWVRTAGEWQLRRVEVFDEDVRPTRTWLGFR